MIFCFATPQSTTEKVQGLVALAAKMAQEGGARSAAAAGEPSAKLLPVADNTLRRRTWTGPPWIARLQQQVIPASPCPVRSH